MTSARCAIDLPADPDATERAGRLVGHRLRAGDTVALVGSLGAGKTTFVRGLAAGLDLDDPGAVASPTYLLVVEHPGGVPLLHADAYLPTKLEAFLLDGGLEYLFDPSKIVAVEWGDRIQNLLPGNTLWVELGPGPGGGRRLVLRTEAGARFPWLTDLPTIWASG